MKAALESVHPFIPSIYNSEFYYIKPNVIELGEEAFGIFACKLKSFSNRPIRDIQLYYALLYEIECKVVHRESQELLDTTFSVFDMNMKETFSNYNITPSTLDNLDEKFTLHGTSNMSYLIKSIFNVYFSTEEQSGDLHEIVLCSCLLQDEVSFMKLGYYDIYFSIRGKLIVETDLVVIPTFMLELDRLLMINSLKISEYELAERFTMKNNVLECVIAPLTIELQEIEYLRPLGESLSHDFKYKTNTDNKYSSSVDENVEEQKNNIWKKTPQSENSSAFSCDEETEINMKSPGNTHNKSLIATPKKSTKHKEELDINTTSSNEEEEEHQHKHKNSLIARLFSNQNVDEEINKLRIRSTRSKKEIQIQTVEEFYSAPHLQDVEPEQLYNDEIAVIELELSGGEFAIFFEPAIESEAEPQGSGHNYGVEIEAKKLRLETKNTAVAVKFMLSKENVDVYVNERFLASYNYVNIFIKFFDKASRAELTHPTEM